MQIRAYEQADEAAVVALWRACDLVVGWNDPVADIEEKLQHGRELFLVGLVEDQVIATVMGGYDGHRGWVYYMAVHPDQQGQGYGRDMMEAIESELKGLGCHKINLQARTTNPQANAFYESIGYKQDAVVSFGKRLDQS